MEFKSKYFSFKTGKSVNKSDLQPSPSDNTATYLKDEFYTSFINFIGTNKLQSSLDLLLFFFNNVSEINSIITYIAQKAADIPVRHVRILGNGKQKDLGETDVIKLLKKPNFINDGRTFTMSCISSFFVYGFIPINKVAPIGWPTPSELFLMPGNNFYPIPERHVNMYGLPVYGTDFRTNPIIKYRQFIDSRPYDFMPEEIIMMNDSNLSFDNGAYLKGMSRLNSAIRSIKALSDLYDTINTLISNKGAAGFLTLRTKAGVIDTGWDEDDRKNVEEKLYSYGTSGGRRPIGVTTKDLGFVRLSVPISEFMPIELKQHEFRTLAASLMFPSVLLNDKEGAIYNNVSLAQKAFYTDCLIPVNNLRLEGLTNGLGLNLINEALIADYSEIECLQKDQKIIIETQKANEELWSQRYKDNIVTLNEYLRAVGLPELQNGNLYARDSETIPLAVRLGVGGTDALQSILSDTQLSQEQKKNILIIVFGLKPEDAQLMSVNETITNNTNGTE